MKGKIMKLLTRQEELILITVYRLGSQSSLIKIRENLLDSTGKEWSISSIYVPLDRLERAGYLTASIGEPEARRGGRAVKLYKLTKEGLEALEQVKSIHDTLWDGIDTLILEK